MNEQVEHDKTSGTSDDSTVAPEQTRHGDSLIILPVRNTVLFPGIILPLAIGRPQSIAAAQDAAKNGQPIGVVLQSDPAVDIPGPEHLHQIGTVCEVLRYITTPDGSHHIVCRGVQRFRILEFQKNDPYLLARVVRETESEIHTPDIDARVHQLKVRSWEAIELLPGVNADVGAAIDNLESAPAIADFVAGMLDFAPADKQQILETFDITERLDKVLTLLSQRIEVLKLSQQIGEQTRHTMAAKQREHILREQLEQIQRELGEGEDNSSELNELRQAVDEAGMPEEVETAARKELKRLERMSDAMSEYTVIRNYLDWLIRLPWNKATDEEIDIANAERILNEDHYGLEKIKTRILEHLAVHKLNPGGKSPILCFVGPPGVGKTSLGQSIARAMGRQFARISLGGVHDEAEIRGHRRTYVGALPGNIIQSISKAETNNPVMMLDELDKLSASFHGDPSSALLEVLDPEQNSSFRDNFLAVPFDLSKVMFIGTANVLDNIPGPLRDRMEVISIPGYTEDEKLQIVRRYLLQRQLTATGLDSERFSISDDAIRDIIHDYTREAGCRNLEREIGAVCRHVAVRVADGSLERMHIDRTHLAEILGPVRFESEVAMRTSVPGVATGLAWTPTGGDILFVETNRVPGNGKLILTGQLGDVMKESAQAALTLVKGQAAALGLDNSIFQDSDIHIHVPAGAIPKDGPSAGVCMYLALVSLLTTRTVRNDTAMTGEISLRGLVLPIGGVKEKVLAAVRAGITIIMLPARNRKDLEDVPASIRDSVKFVWLDKVEDAVSVALDPPVSQRSRSPEEA
ncbi:MAG: endopeptidase La, partial [Rhodothermales bacterium]|nr:endopeptidase La [Rhodothermales bacterium]